MARTNLTLKQLRNGSFDQTKLEAIKTKLDEHDTAIDALEGGTTSTVVTIHPVRAVATSNVSDLSAFTVAHDGLTMVANERVALVGQSTGSQNGIYTIGTVATGTAPLTRATDFDASAEVKPGTLIAVAAGTAGASTIWQLTNTSSPTVGTTALTFAQVLNKTQLATYLALTTQAGLIGSDAAGYVAATVKLQLAEVKAIADANAAAIFAKRTVTVDEEALTGASAAVNIGAALPTNAVVVAHEIVVNEQGVLAGNDLAITIGGTDADAIVASTDLDALAAGVYQGTLGIHPRGSFSAEQLVATFTASDLATLSAGNWTFNVWYHVLA